ncbi:hypothetical protein V1264_019528 [Littorina saxatilis]|uniref:Uncharacterized protein n=2 Tax=Littorina saxatilis TaxID=31220 RepID=A0AAN9GDD4_9CAEN
MLRVARRMRSDKRGDISYQELAANVRNHIREERLEDQRLQRLENKKRQQRKRILQSDLPLYAPPSFSYDPALYNMYDSNVINRLEAAEEAGDFSAGPQGRLKRMESDVVSRRSSALAGSRRRRTPPAKVVLPGIDTPKRMSTARRRFRGIVERGVAMALGRNTPMTLVRHGTKGIPGAPRPLYLLGASRPKSKDRAVGTSDAGTRSGTPKGRGLSDTPQGMIRKGHGHIPPGMINSSTIFDAGSSAKGNRYRTPSHTEKSPPVLISKGHAHIPPGMIGSRSNTPKGMMNIPAGVSGSPRDGSRRNFDLGIIAKETLKEARNNRAGAADSPQKGNRKGLGDIPPTQKGSRVDVAHSLTVPGQLPKESVSGGSKSKTKTAKQQAPTSKSPISKKASHSPTKLPDINATKSLVGGYPEKETTSGAGNKNRPERSLLTMPPDKGQIARARRGVEYTDENRRL